MYKLVEHIILKGGESNNEIVSVHPEVVEFVAPTTSDVPETIRGQRFVRTDKADWLIGLTIFKASDDGNLDLEA